MEKIPSLEIYIVFSFNPSSFIQSIPHPLRTQTYSIYREAFKIQNSF